MDRKEPKEKKKNLKTMVVVEDKEMFEKKSGGGI